MLGTPSAEIEIDAALLHSLLLDQHPDLAHQPVETFETGWDNVMFRIGRQLLARMPRRHLAASLISKEQHWLPQLPPLTLAIPRPVRIGRPAGDFPWNWSVVPWLEGEAADRSPPEPSEAERLAGFLKALHLPSPPTMSTGIYRGCRLADRREAINARLGRLRSSTLAITDAVEAAWRAGLTAPPSKARYWVHGDLHARNILVHKGKLAAVIDWGDLCAGDPAVDLVAIWALFDSPQARREGLECYGASSTLIARARGWVVALGAILFDSGRVDNERHAKMGADMLRRLAEDQLD